MNVTSAQMATALNSLPDGGIILLRANVATVYSNNTSLTVNLPSAISVLNKPFVIAFDGPIGSNNSLNNNRNIEILVKATETNSFVYELGTTSTDRKYVVNNFPGLNSDYKVSELHNTSGSNQPILMLNSYTIQAINNKTWSFTNRDCFILNPKS